MKLKILTITISTVLLLGGCTKQTEPEAAEVDYKDQLDNPNTPQEVKVKILCHDYPEVYKIQYMPALIKISPKPYTEEKLLSDLKSATDYYKDALAIRCNQ